jgi:hypothetical protein
LVVSVTGVRFGRCVDTTRGYVRGDAGVQASIASMEPWQAAIAKHVDALVCEFLCRRGEVTTFE